MKSKSKTIIIFVVIVIIYTVVCAFYFRTKVEREERDRQAVEKGRQTFAIVDQFLDRVDKLEREKEETGNEREIQRINSELKKIYDDFFKEMRQISSEK